MRQQPGSRLQIQRQADRALREPPQLWALLSTATGQTSRARCRSALDRAAAYVRHLLSGRMSLRRSPEVKFLFDQSVAAQDRVEQILYELKQEDATRASEQTAPAEATESQDKKPE